jgi:rod shape-determining protein MreC
VLVTSGLDGRFPRGYPVAKVLKIESGRGEQFASITATPIAHLDRSLEVLLVWRRDATSTASKSAKATAQDAADLDFTP